MFLHCSISLDPPINLFHATAYLNIHAVFRFKELLDDPVEDLSKFLQKGLKTSSSEKPEVA